VRLTFRRKLLLILGAAALAFVLVAAVGAIAASRADAQLQRIQAHYLPLLELAPKLEADLEHLRRGFQDAVAAQDQRALLGTHDARSILATDLALAQRLLGSERTSALQSAVNGYFSDGYEVSRRLIAGATSEQDLDSIRHMQKAHAEAVRLVHAVAGFDRAMLVKAFAAVQSAQHDAEGLRLGIAAGCLALVLALSTWLSGNVFASLEGLSAGFERFSRNDFEQPIPVLRNDEFGDLATRANHMAASLRAYDEQRARDAWMHSTQVELALQVQGELEPKQLADRAAAFLAKAVGAPLAALYVAEPDGGLRLLGAHGLTERDRAGPSARFAPGEGLLGAAAADGELVVLEDLPAAHFRIRSGLGETVPRSLALLPIRHLGQLRAVVELALLKPLTGAHAELLREVPSMLAVALEVSRIRSAQQALLIEATQQAERLAGQEEQLRAINEELHRRQQELETSNTALVERGDELEHERGALEQRNAQLEEARSHLQQQARQLASASEYKSQFLANMSHELRTPLNSMLLLSNMLAENNHKNLSEKEVEYARVIHAAGSDLLALINDILDLAKIEAGKRELSLSRVKLSDLLAHLDRVHRPVASNKGITLTLQLAADAPEEVICDRARLEQMLINLIGNALKFTERGSVSLQVTRPHPELPLPPGAPPFSPLDTVAFALTDTGIGIAPQHTEVIFRAFEQANGGIDRRYGGTGLGLSIVRQLAELMKGGVTVRSELGKGSTFVLYLPERADVDESVALPPREREPAPSPPPVEPGRTRLLIVEDEDAMASELTRLATARGIETIRAKTGEQALRLAREHLPQGIVLDVKLPDLNGFVVLGRLKADLATRAIPVHFVSALEGVERGLSMGAVGYLTKPATRDELERALTTLLRHAEEASRVLLIEDDERLRDALAAALESRRITTLRAASAERGLELLRTHTVDCVVLDLGLPGMDGLQFLEELERVGPSHSPVIVYTGRTLSVEEANKLQRYACKVLQKGGRSEERVLHEVTAFLASVAAPRPEPAPASLRGKSVLVVDDDMRTTYAVSAMLRSRGLDVLLADNGLSGIATLEAHPEVDAVLMDVMMPELNGYEAMRRIRSDRRFTELPMIALTANAMTGDREKCLEAGANEYMAKPVDNEQLVSLLGRLLCSDRAQRA
jgi:signal transduction histidine kinase/DNA-binding response OmpR family regulator